MVDNSPSKNIFISYSRVNREIVARLISDLQAKGIDVWIDKQGLKAGTPNWEQALRDAIRNSRAVLLIASPDSRRSNYVSDELSIAEMYNRPVYPVWSTGEQWADSIIIGRGHIQYIDIRGEAYHAGVEEIVATLANTTVSTQPTVPEPEPDFEPRNPYKGLNAFTSRDRGDFFGRDRLVEDLLSDVEKSKTDRFLAIVGPSGSGKSSVVMAGLLPKLQELHNDWVFLSPMVPGTHPLERLTITLVEQLGGSMSDIRKDLEDPSTRGLHLLGSRLAKRPGAGVVLLVDQFEELFTQTIDEKERREFIDLLTTAVSEPEGSLFVIVTLRADFYDGPLNYADLVTLIKDHTIPIAPLSLSDLRDTIEKPAALPDVKLEFDDGLVAELVFEMREQSGALPLLQFTLDQLFQRRDKHHLTFAAYQDIGGVKGALAKHAEATYQGLPSDAHRGYVRALFLRLIEPGASPQEMTRHRANLNELVLSDPEQSRIYQEVAAAFVTARLLTTNKVGETTTIEVSHEALLREWQRLANWLADAHNDIQMQRQIAEDAANWIERGKKPDDDGLYRGIVLINAQAWASRNVASADEGAFIDASAGYQANLIRLEERRKQELLDAAERANKAQNEAHLATQRSRQARRLLVISGAVVIIVTLLATGFSYQYTQQILSQAAQTVTPIPLTLTFVSDQVKVQQLSAKAIKELSSDTGNVETAALLSIRALRIGYDEVADDTLLRAIEHTFTRQILYDTDAVYTVAFSPTGKYIAAGGKDMIVRLWDAQTGKPIRTFTGHKGVVNSIIFSPDENWLVAGSGDNSAILWDVQTGQQVKVFSGHTGSVYSVAISSDGKQLLTGSRDKTARLWDIASAKLVRTFSHEEGVFAVAFSFDGKYALTGSADKTARLWDAATGNAIHVFKLEDAVWSVAFSPDGKFAITGCGDNNAYLWNVETGNLYQTLHGHSGGIQSVAYSADGHYIVTASADHTARIWSADNGQVVRILSGHLGTVWTAAFSPDGNSVITGSDDTAIRLWDAHADSSIDHFVYQSKPILDIAYSADGKLFATASADGTVALWKADSGEAVTSFINPAGSVYAIAFSHDGKYIVSGSADNSIRFWNIATGKFERTFQGSNEGFLYSVAFSHSGQFLAAGGTDAVVTLWDLQSGQSVAVLSGNNSTVAHIAFSPDDQTLAVASQDGFSRVYEAKSQKLIYTLSGGSAVAFSPDGTMLLTGDDGVRVWNLQSGGQLNVFHEEGSITVGVFSSTGKDIVVSSGGEARLIDAQTGKVYRVFEGHEGIIHTAIFSPDGKYILTAGDDGIVHHWTPNYQDFIQEACKHLLRDFSPEEQLNLGIQYTDKTCINGS